MKPLHLRINQPPPGIAIQHPEHPNTLYVSEFALPHWVNRGWAPVSENSEESQFSEETDVTTPADLFQDEDEPVGPAEEE